MNLQKTNECNQTLSYFLGLCSCFGTIKFLKMLRFNKHISFLGLSLKRCFGELVSISIVFFLIFMSFVQLMYLIYGTDMEGYSSLLQSAKSAFQMMLGKLDASQFIKDSSLLAPIVFSFYNILIICFALNIFISIIANSFEAIRNEAKTENLEFDLIDLIWNKIGLLFKKTPSQNTHEANHKYRNYLETFLSHVNRLLSFTYKVRI